MKYAVKTIHDDYDCEDCGASYAEGFEIYRDGELVHTMKPVAHCLGGEFYTPEDWAVWIIRDLGDDVWIDGWEAAQPPIIDTPPILRHNGVGEADMYSDEEYAQMMNLPFQK